MPGVLLGVLVAFAASAAFVAGLGLQAAEARAQPAEHALRLRLLLGLLRRRRWLMGTGLTLVAWVLQGVALLLAPLSVVQPALVGGLLVLLAAGPGRAGPPARRDLAAIAAVIGGLVVLVVTSPERTSADDLALGGLVGLAAVALVALAPYALREVRPVPPAALAVAAGLAYGCSGIGTKLLVDGLERGVILVALGWFAAVVLAEVTAVGNEMTALQARPAAQVAPVMFVLEIVVPVGLAPPLAGEAWARDATHGALFAAALVVVLVGAAVLGRRPHPGG